MKYIVQEVNFWSALQQRPNGGDVVNLVSDSIDSLIGEIIDLYGLNCTLALTEYREDGQIICLDHRDWDTEVRFYVNTIGNSVPMRMIAETLRPYVDDVREQMREDGIVIDDPDGYDYMY